MAGLRWSSQPVTRDTWNLFRGSTVLGEVWWIRALRYPHLTMQRIVDGLNGVHGDEQPARTWSLATEGSPGRHPLKHNGETVGELVWLQPPTRPAVWHGRLLAGLNWCAPSRANLPPEPLPAQPLERHLRSVS